MTGQGILIGCIGNIFLGDDGFGVEVARRMAGRPLPPGVILKDFGIRSFDLTYALLDAYDLVVLVDACARGGKPGEIYLIEADPVQDGVPGAPAPRLEGHGMNPLNVLRMVKSMGGPSNRILIVACEPAELGSDDEGKLGLSEPVTAAVDEAIHLIEKIVAERLLSKPLEAVSQ
jgi:hydrogenase maturation protease